MNGMLLAASVLVASPAAAQVVMEMTPELIREAIAASKAVGCYSLKTSGKWLHGEDSGCITTPYSRVVQASQSAREKYQPFTEADVTPEMLAPVVQVFAFPPASFIMGRGKVGPPLDVKAVVVAPAKSKDREAAILPSHQVELDSRYQNMLGATFEATGLVATFPLDVLSEKNEVRFVYDGKGCADWKNKLSSECAVRFNLKGVR